MRVIRTAAFFCILIVILGCEKQKLNIEVSELKKEIQVLKDSLYFFQNRYYNFRGIKPIANSQNQVYKVNDEYIFDCFMIANQLRLGGNSFPMEVKGESTGGNMLKFEQVNGGIKMHYTPKFSGRDTLNLEYSFGLGVVPEALAIPLMLEVSVIGNDR